MAQPTSEAMAISAAGWGISVPGFRSQGRRHPMLFNPLNKPQKPDRLLQIDLAQAANLAVKRVLPGTYDTWATAPVNQGGTPHVSSQQFITPGYFKTPPIFEVGHPGDLDSEPVVLAPLLAPPNGGSSDEPPYFTPDVFDQMVGIVEVRRSQEALDLSKHDANPPNPPRPCYPIHVSKEAIQLRTLSSAQPPPSPPEHTNLHRADKLFSQNPESLQARYIIHFDVEKHHTWAIIPPSPSFPHKKCDWCARQLTFEGILYPKTLCMFHLYFSATGEELRFMEEHALSRLLNHRGKSLSINEMMMFVETFRKECTESMTEAESALAQGGNMNVPPFGNGAGMVRRPPGLDYATPAVNDHVSHFAGQSNGGMGIPSGIIDPSISLGGNGMGAGNGIIDVGSSAYHAASQAHDFSVDTGSPGMNENTGNSVPPLLSFTPYNFSTSSHAGQSNDGMGTPKGISHQSNGIGSNGTGVGNGVHTSRGATGSSNTFGMNGSSSNGASATNGVTAGNGTGQVQRPDVRKTLWRQPSQQS